MHQVGMAFSAAPRRPGVEKLPRFSCGPGEPVIQRRGAGTPGASKRVHDLPGPRCLWNSRDAWYFPRRLGAPALKTHCRASRAGPGEFAVQRRGAGTPGCSQLVHYSPGSRCLWTSSDAWYFPRRLGAPALKNCRASRADQESPSFNAEAPGCLKTCSLLPGSRYLWTSIDAWYFPRRLGAPALKTLPRFSCSFFTKSLFRKLIGSIAVDQPWMPKRSTSMPKRAAQNVFSSGTTTLPPLASS